MTLPHSPTLSLGSPQVNPEQLVSKIDFPLFKSPNCVSVGTSLALKAIADAFGIAEASVCTFQSLSGRGDAMYPRELVQGNVYPVRSSPGMRVRARTQLVSRVHDGGAPSPS